MCDHWMPLIKLPLSAEQFWQLPRNGAYKYEFIEGQMYLSPRPRHYHALLDLQPLPAPQALALRQIAADDWEALAPVFAGAFRTVQPFGSLDDDTRVVAARQALDRTRTGGDGPLIEPASFVAVEDGSPTGAVLITLLPDGDPVAWDSYQWLEPPPADCIARRLGRPHLTWVFVSPWHAGRGLGSELLAAAVNALLALGFTQLLSTFMIGNDASALWHWRNGFLLLPYPGSLRHRRTRSPL
jgi:GNAT superfamily N-acetyltransferase